MEKEREERKSGLKARPKLARLLAAAALTASIFGAKEARAQEAPRPDPAPSGTVIALGGARLSASGGLSLDPFSQTVGYSGFSYHLGDDDFSMDFRGRNTNVIGYLRGFDFSDLSRLPQLLDFGRQLRENLGIYSPGSYHGSIRGSLEAFGEGYTAGRGYADGVPYSTELGVSGYAFARGSAYYDLNLDYDNWDLPTRFDSRLSAGFTASMLSRVSLGLETVQAAGPFSLGYGIMGRRFFSYDGTGSIRASIDAGLFSGFTADAETSIWQRTVHGYDFVPYLTLLTREGPLRLSVDAGLDVREQDSRDSSDHRRMHASLDSSQDMDQDTQTSVLTHTVSVVPVIGASIAPGGALPVFPILSFSTLDGPSARATLGVSADRLMASGYVSTGLEAGGESFVVLRGGPSRREYDDYLFRNEAARAGLFPSYRSRMLAARQAFLTSSDSLMLRTSLDYDPRFPQIAGESGVVYSSRRFFIEDGLKVFGGESVGGGLYSSFGNRYFYTTGSYSRTFAGSGPIVQSIALAIGGFIP